MLPLINYDKKAEDIARPSTYEYGHINMLGRYSFAMPEEVKRGELRPFRTTEKP